MRSGARRGRSIASTPPGPTSLVGRLLDAVRASGQWDRALIAVTSDHGEEFGEMGQVLHGGNLGRQLIEVPLLVKLPKGFRGALARPAGKAVANARLFATLVEAAGGTPAPGAAPSLFAPSALPVLSELYSQNGTNQFSLVDGERQLLWTTRFGPAEPGYYTARLVGLGGRPLAPPTEPAADDPRPARARLRGGAAALRPLRQPPGADAVALAAGRGRAGRRAGSRSERGATKPRVSRAACALPGRPPTAPRPCPPSRPPAASRRLSAEDLAELRALGYVAGGQ